MKKVIKIVLTLVLLAGIGAVLFGIVGRGNENASGKKLSVISTIFPGYDFTRAVAKDNAEISMLLKPGAEMHSFEPSAQDIINIQKSDMFIYVGGESDQWIDRVLDSLDDSKTKVIRLMDYIDIKEEELKEGMEEEAESEDAEEEGIEYDEHVWTSPKNAIKLVNAIKNALVELDPENKETYENNANEYISELNKLDQDIREVVENGKRKTLIFGDRFPFRYFVDEYGLDYFAAFPGCAAETEASAATIATLINKVKEVNAPVVFHIEFSNQNVAKTISEGTGAKVLQFHSAHNVSAKDFENGVTYIDIMRDNLKNLKEALN